MQKRKRFFPVLGLALCLFILITARLSVGDGRPLIQQVIFQDPISGIQLTPYYESAEDRYFLFLPAHVSNEDVKVSLEGLGGSVTFQGYGTELTDAPLEMDIILHLSTLFQKQTVTIQIWRCTNLPTLYLKAESDTLDYLKEEKSRTRSVTATLLSGSGEHLFTQAALLGGRGNTTWNQEKRPYNLKLEEPVVLEGFGKISKLCLLAEYSDETKLRNALVLNSGKYQEIEYAASYLHANVFVNGEYQGLYGLSDRDMYKLHAQEDGVQAVFVLTNDSGNFPISLGKRDADVIFGNPQLAKEKVVAFEQALIQGDWDRCRKLIDVESFVKKYALEEFFGNEDMVHGSQYFYIDSQGRIHCMLPWDYDFSMGSTFTYFNNRHEYSVLARHVRNRKDTEYYIRWYALLLDFPQYREMLVSTMESDYDDDFLLELKTYLHQTNEQINESRSCDLRRWHQAKAFVCPPSLLYHRASGMDGKEDYESYFQDYFSERRDILYNYFRSPDDYCIVEFAEDQYANFCIPRGTELAPYLDGATIMDVYTPHMVFTGWRTESGIPPDQIGQVTENITFYASFEPSADGHEEMDYSLECEAETTVDKILAHLPQIMLCCMFALTAVVLFICSIWEMGPWEKKR